MKIERIADNAINIYISKKELSLRNMNAETLKEGTSTFNDLVWEAVDCANMEFGHEFDARQLRIAKKADSSGGIVLTIAHDMDDDYGDNMFYDEADDIMMRNLENIFRDTIKKSLDNFEDSSSHDYESDEYGDEFGDDNEEDEENIVENNAENKNQPSPDSNIYFGGIYDKLRMNKEQQIAAQANSNINKGNTQGAQNTPGAHNQQSNMAPDIQGSEQPPVATPKVKTHLSMWDVLIFPNFNDMLEFLSRNKAFKTLSSSLYFYRGAYYLALKSNSKNIRTLRRLEALAVDYNSTYLPAETFLPLLKERGNVIMENGAISKLIKHFEL